MSEHWQKDSDTIFKAVSSADFQNYDEAQQAVVMLYIPDLNFSRAGISDALKRLERHYSNRLPRGTNEGEVR